jgi:hypothetical protein
LSEEAPARANPHSPTFSQAKPKGLCTDFGITVYTNTGENTSRCPQLSQELIERFKEEVPMRNGDTFSIWIGKILGILTLVLLAFAYWSLFWLQWPWYPVVSIVLSIMAWVTGQLMVRVLRS